ncbi:MAG: hypothetical protein LBV38_04455 [Alistipes sp.]|nr:hypothetical protein [Alistipes sp.]
MNVLYDLIKEDRNEIRTIKNWMYTSIQAWLAASFAVLAFIISKASPDGEICLDCKEEWIVVLTILLFLGISWVVFYFQNKDLHFTRLCLRHREEILEQSCIEIDYFGDIDQPLPKWLDKFRKKWWHTEFKNDAMPWFAQLAASLVYVLEIVGVWLLL